MPVSFCSKAVLFPHLGKFLPINTLRIAALLTECNFSAVT
jgi:hypothetical protein